MRLFFCAGTVLGLGIRPPKVTVPALKEHKLEVLEMAVRPE